MLVPAGVAGGAVAGMALGATVRDAPWRPAPQQIILSLERETGLAIPGAHKSACSWFHEAVSNAALAVCPGVSVVGAPVTVYGRNCTVPGVDAVVAFVPDYDDQGVARATFGSSELERVPIDASGQFVLSTTVPRSLGPIRGHGGGATTPGTYRFSTIPALCSVVFTVRPD